MRKGIIYAAISPSNKMYIGRSIDGLKKRAADHRRCVNRYDYPFYRALKKYGFRRFRWAVIYTDIDEPMLNIAEICAIYTFGTYGFGYNATPGGEGVFLNEEQKERRSKRMRDNNPAKRPTVRKKISRAKKGQPSSFKGKKHTEETKRKLSKMNKGRPSAFKGRNHTEETKKKLSEANKGLRVGESNPFFGKTHTEKTKRKMRANRKNVREENNAFFGKTHSEKSKAKMRRKRTGNKKRTTLMPNQVKEIVGKYNAGGYSFERLGREYGVSKTAISNVINLRTQRAINILGDKKKEK